MFREKGCEKMRLIDADAIKWDKCEDAEGNPVYVLDKRDIDTQKTAYDVDKVVKQLERISTSSRLVGCSRSCAIITLNEAVEIVKGGGVNDRE